MMHWDWVLHNPEGQFLERKGCYDRSGGRVRRRDVRSLARDIAETLSAMANADGGTLVVGVEDDGTPTGVDYPRDRLNVLQRHPETWSVHPSVPALRHRGCRRWTCWCSRWIGAPSHTN